MFLGLQKGAHDNHQWSWLLEQKCLIQKLGIHKSKEQVVDEHLAIAEYMPFYSLCEHCW